MISRASRVKILPEVVSAEIEGEITLLNSRTHEYLSLNRVGSHVWRMIEEYDDLATIHRLMIDEYDVDPDALWADLFELLTDMENAGLVVIE